MRTLSLGLIVFALGIGAAALVLSPGAGARTAAVDGTITGHVGTANSPNAFSIAVSVATVPAGTYEFDITDHAAIHNFDLCAGTTCNGSNSIDATSIEGAGSVAWIVALSPGTYSFRCDAHSSMHGSFTVTGSSTTTTDTTPITTTATTTTTPSQILKFTSVMASRSKVTVTAKANPSAHVTASLLKKGVAVANAAADGTIVKFILKPAARLTPGAYVIQLTAGQTVKRKKITIM